MTIKKSYICVVICVASSALYGFKNYRYYKGENMSLTNKNVSHTSNLAINMYEKDNAIIAEINVAGINPADVHVEIEDGQLHIFGEHRAKEEINEAHYYYKESAYGRFDRLFSLPKNIDKTGMTYDIEDGILKVIIPKK